MYPNLLVVTIGLQPAHLNSLNYKLWPVLEGTRRHHNLESLKQALVEAVDNFPMDVGLTDFSAVLGQMVTILNNFL